MVLRPVFGGRVRWRAMLAVALSLSACGASASGGIGRGSSTPAPVRTMLPSLGTPDQVVQAMAPGINFGNTLESLDKSDTPPFTVSKETAWDNPPANQTIFNAYAAAGFKSVRIPVTWDQYVDANGHIAPFWLARVKQVVDYALNAGLIAIINIHHDGWVIPDTAHKADADARMTSYWTQIATYFAGYDNRLLFASANEVHMPDVYSAPMSENCAVQVGFNQAFVDAVRSTGGNNRSRTLIVQLYAGDIGFGLDICKQATLPTDKIAHRLIVEFHFYKPFSFVDSGPRWANIWQWGALATDPSAVDSCCKEGFVRKQFDRMKSTYVDRGVPVILGEYGASTKPVGPGKGIKTFVDYWDGYVTHSAISHDFVPIYWDTGDLIDRTNGVPKDKGVLDAIISGVTKDPEPQTSIGVDGG